MYFQYAWVIVALVVPAIAAPAQPVARDVSSGTLEHMTLYAQYAAAAYCTSNINSTGTKLTCSTGNCPEVQAANTETLYEFNAKTQFGDTAGYLAVDFTRRLLVMSFRGSRTASNWIANFDFFYEDIDSVCSGCEAHMGFWRAWETVADELMAEVKAASATYPGYQIVFTGHSLGAALATLGATVMRKDGYAIDLYTYGSPRVGNYALAEFITNQGNIYRATHTDDLVPKLPPIWVGYSHPSPEYWITTPNGVTPSTSDIEVIQGIDSLQGNAGTDDSSIDAHNFYIIHIDGCP